MCKLVVIESPYAATDRETIRKHLKYAHRAIRDSLRRGEAPIASHVLYTRALDDNVPEQRLQGINAGLAWSDHADLVAVYCDLGISPGMRAAMEVHAAAGRKIERRSLKDLKNV